jgi:hydrogenase expression/formation protein HypD
VCVSSEDYIDTAIAYAKLTDVIVLTYGDMLKVPGTKSSLEKERARGSSVHVLYSALDCLGVARENPQKKIVFLAVGFETTAPTVALTILAAERGKIKNLFFLSALKLIPPAMEALVCDRRLDIQGFLCPGHVSTIIGTKPYEFIPRKFKIGCCIAGFEPLDILQGLYFLLRQITENRPRVKNQYLRAVKTQGNPKARRIIAEVFKISDASWRGLGKIPHSGLEIKGGFSRFDAERALGIKCAKVALQRTMRCRCADVLKGIILPPACPLFLKACRPDNPFGPCMVSSEGACNAYYRYKRKT